MTDLRKGEQRGGKRTSGVGGSDGRESQEGNEREEFGTSERATRGTNRDFDDSGESRNQGHGHSREERGEK